MSVTKVARTLGYEPPQARLDRLVQALPANDAMLVNLEAYMEVCRLQLCLAHAARIARPQPHKLSLQSTLLLILSTIFHGCTIRECAFFLRRADCADDADKLLDLASENIADVFTLTHKSWVLNPWDCLAVHTLVDLLLYLATWAGRARLFSRMLDTMVAESPISRTAPTAPAR